jgi:hypothetical protein
MANASLLAVTRDSKFLVELANTGHGEDDELASNDSVHAWWTAIGPGNPADPPGPGTDVDLEALRAARALIRGLTSRNNGVDIEVDGSAVGTIPLSFEVGAQPDLALLGPSTLPRLIVSRVVVELLRSSSNPEWKRVKACPGPGCRWVFVDRSRNGSRRWCQMSECGNRAKGAAFRTRQRH